jgi:hypothetical protein
MGLRCGACLCAQRAGRQWREDGDGNEQEQTSECVWHGCVVGVNERSHVVYL